MERDDGQGAGEGWALGARFAWTERDGPSRAPTGPSSATVRLLAATLLCTSIAMLVTDTLCPEHRAVVIALGVVAVGGSIASGVALLAGRAFAPSFALLSALCGMGIGVVDVLHVPVRGAILTAVFGLAVLLAVRLVWQAAEAQAWSRRVDEQLTPLRVPEVPEVVESAEESAAVSTSMGALPDVESEDPEQVVARRRPR